MCLQVEPERGANRFRVKYVRLPVVVVVVVVVVVFVLNWLLAKIPHGGMGLARPVFLFLFLSPHLIQKQNR